MSITNVRVSKRTKGAKSGSTSGVPPLIAINTLVFDVSGSTASMGDAPAEQLHSLLHKFQEDARTNDSNIQVSLHVFSDSISQVIPRNQDEYSVDMRTFDIPSMVTILDMLCPRGCTALYDAGIEGFAHINRIYDHEFSKLSRAVRALKPYISKCYVLATDGMDNRSTHTISDFKTHTLAAKEKGIIPLFLFANIGSEMGQKMGFKRNNAAQFQPTYAGVSNMLRATTSILRQVSSGQTQTIDTQTMTQDTDPVSPQIDPIDPADYSAAPPTMPMPSVFGTRAPPLRRY